MATVGDMTAYSLDEPMLMVFLGSVGHIILGVMGVWTEMGADLPSRDRLIVQRIFNVSVWG